MQINLVQSEIQEALTEFVSNQGFDVSGKDVVVTMVAGRGKKGHSAIIEILPKGTAPVAETGKKTSKSKDKEAKEPDAKTPAIDFNDKD
jgi:hypothetical protein